MLIGSHATSYEGSAYHSAAILVQHGVAHVQTIHRRQAQKTCKYHSYNLCFKKQLLCLTQCESIYAFTRVLKPL